MMQSVKAFRTPEESFYRDETGTLRHVLQGDALPYGGKARKICSCPQAMTVCFPVGAASEDGAWGGFCRVCCRLVLPHRYVLRHEAEIQSGETAGQILADAVRSTVRREMESCPRPESCRADSEAEMWTQIRRKLYEQLLKEGWQLEAFQPGSFHYKGA